MTGWATSKARIFIGPAGAAAGAFPGPVLAARVDCVGGGRVGVAAGFSAPLAERIRAATAAPWVKARNGLRQMVVFMG
jgi:hypothetical protein